MYLKNIIVIKSKTHLEGLKKKVFQKFIFINFSRLTTVVEVGGHKFANELLKMAPSGRPTMVTRVVSGIG